MRMREYRFYNLRISRHCHSANLLSFPPLSLYTRRFCDTSFLLPSLALSSSLPLSLFSALFQRLIIDATKIQSDISPPPRGGGPAVTRPRSITSYFEPYEKHIPRARRRPLSPADANLIKVQLIPVKSILIRKINQI